MLIFQQLPKFYLCAKVTSQSQSDDGAHSWGGGRGATVDCPVGSRKAAIIMEITIKIMAHNIMRRDALLGLDDDDGPKSRPEPS